MNGMGTGLGSSCCSKNSSDERHLLRPHHPTSLPPACRSPSLLLRGVVCSPHQAQPVVLPSPSSSLCLPALPAFPGQEEGCPSQAGLGAPGKTGLGGGSFKVRPRECTLSLLSLILGGRVPLWLPASLSWCKRLRPLN